MRGGRGKPQTTSSGGDRIGERLRASERDAIIRGDSTAAVRRPDATTHSFSCTRLHPLHNLDVMALHRARAHQEGEEDEDTEADDESEVDEAGRIRSRSDISQF